MPDEYLFGVIEAGGTKFNCAIGSSTGELRQVLEIPTTTPEETFAKMVEYFKSQTEFSKLAAIGIASFGPVDLDVESPTYGYITTTVKPGWQNTAFAPRLKKEFGLLVGFDTDVNGAALGELKWGAAKGLNSCVYITVGTGIGGGLVMGDQPVHGLLHPEMGHMILPIEAGDTIGKVCTFHDNCLEGLASGPAIMQRSGKKAQDLPPDHPDLKLVAHYLALGLVNIILVASPERIILGGGVMLGQPSLFPMVRQEVKQLLNGYINVPALTTAEIDEYIVPPTLGGHAGLSGAIVLADRARQAASTVK